MTVLAAWLLALLGLAVLGLFISVVMWRDDIACRDWYWEEWQFELAQHDVTVELLAEAQEQLYAKLTLEEALEDGRIVVVTDTDLQELAADKGAADSFSFDRLITPSLGEAE